MGKTSAVREAALGMERIDTHSHLTEDCRAFDRPPADPQNSQWSRLMAEACRVLYDIDPGTLLRPDAPEEIFQKAKEIRAQGPWEAFRYAFDKARIKKQLVFCIIHPESRPFKDNGGRLAYLAFIEHAINGHFEYPCPDFNVPDFNFYESICNNLRRPLNTLADYMDALDETIDGWRSWGVVGLKTARAYTSGLFVSDPKQEEARAAFSKKRDMTREDFQIVHDFAFRHCLEACKRNGLPVVIHTGFQIWGHSNLSQANPLLLHNLLVDKRYKDITFVLLHGGNPYVGETTYLAGMFPNVIIDFTWISWMTPVRFKFALAEWLAIVPHNRFCWGSDSGSPETIAGLGGITRKLIADVLEESIAERLIDEKYALEFIENAYLKTPQRVFGV